MQKIIFACLVLVLTLPVFAQQQALKWNVGSLVNGNISLNYEYAFARHWSVQLHGSWMPQRGLPKYLSSRIWKNTDNPDQTITIAEPKFAGWGLTPEFRYYFFAKEATPRGLYAAAYLRTWLYSGRSTVYYKETNGFNTNLSALVRYSALRPGLQIGYHGIIADHFSIDGFVGANYGYNGLRAVISGDLLTDTYDVLMNELIEQAQLQGTITQQILESIKNDFLPQVNQVSFDTGFALPGFRAGVTLGYAFGGGQYR